MGSYTVVACFANSRIALKHVISDDSLGSLVKMDKTYLLFELDRDQYVYIKDYGGIAFFNIEEKKRVEIIESLNSLVNISEGNITEKIIVSIGNQIHNERFEEIFVTKLTLDVVHIICLNLTQSVALFYYQSLTKDLLQSTVVHIASLEEHGKFKMKHQQLLKRIGATLNLKNTIAQNLYIFDTPQLAWENQYINKVDAQLNIDLELKLRYAGIKEELNIIQENLNLFKDLSLHAHSSMLEWIIILLILFEILQVLF